MKKFLFLLLTISVFAQQRYPQNPNSYVAGRYVAFNYGKWSIRTNSVTGTLPGVGTLGVTVETVTLPDGRKIMPFNTNAPITVDQETVTPSSIQGCYIDNTIGNCQITATFTQVHYAGGTIRSGTFGLQEALNDSATTGGVVTVDGSWVLSGGTQAMVTNAIVPGNVGIEDGRTGIPSAPLVNGAVVAKNIPVSILTFGAKCDGVTDDTAAFQAAWNSINTAGGEIDFPQGTCSIPNGVKFNQLSPNSASVRIFKGMGMYQTILLCHNAPICVEMGGMVGVIVRDLEIYDNGSVGGGSQAALATYRTDWTQGYAGQCGSHVFENVEIASNSSIADIFSVGCEVNAYYGLSAHQGGAGSVYYLNSYNAVGLTANTYPINAVGASNTVNHFYGGALLNYGTGPAVYFSNGSADDLTFNGVYMDATTVPTVQFGGMYGGSAGFESMQGSKVFHTTRFENGSGTAACIGITASGIDHITLDGGTSFGCAGQDIQQTNTSWTGGSAGLSNSDIGRNNWSGHGVTLGNTLNDRLDFGPNTLNILTNSYVSNDHIEAKAFNLQGNNNVIGTIMTQNDDIIAGGSLRDIYGPWLWSGLSGYGSAVVMQPFQSNPVSPINGELAMADGVHWQPNGLNTQTLMQYNTSLASWTPVISTTWPPQAVGPTFSTPSGFIIPGTTVTDTCPGSASPYISTGTTPVAGATGIVVSSAETLFGLCQDGGYNTFGNAIYNITAQDYATFVGTTGTLLSAYTTHASKTFILYTAAGGVTIPQLDGAGNAVLPSGTLSTSGFTLDTLTPSSANYTVGATFKDLNASSSCVFNVLARALSASATFYEAFYQNGSIQLWAGYNSTSHQFANVSYTWAVNATHTLTLSVTGSNPATLAVAVDGVPISGSPFTDTTTTTFLAGVGQGGFNVNGASCASATNFYIQ